MASPFWQCPRCHKLARKDEELFELTDGTMSLGMNGTGKCPNCRSPVDLQSLYVEAKYDVAVEDIYSGKYGTHIVENIRQLYDAGKINLTEEEKVLLSSSGKGTSSK